MKNQLKNLLIATSLLTVTSYGHAFECIVLGSDCFGDTCAPEVKEGNLQATDRVLKELAQGELKQSPQFQSMVKQGNSLKNDAKVKFYMDQIGIASDIEFVEFIGARKVDNKYIETLSKNTSITPAESEKVLNKLSTSLLGGLR